MWRTSGLLATKLLLCPCPKRGRRSWRPKEGGRAEREFEKRKEVGPAAHPATPGCFPRGRLEVPAGPGRAMAPGAKLTRSDMEWVRLGLGPDRRRAGGQESRPGRCRGADSVDVGSERPPASRSGSLCCCGASGIGQGRQGERKVGTSPSRPHPAHSLSCLPTATGLLFFLQVPVHFWMGSSRAQSCLPLCQAPSTAGFPHPF